MAIDGRPHARVTAARFDRMLDHLLDSVPGSAAERPVATVARAAGEADTR